MHFHWFPFSDLHPLLCGSARLSYSIRVIPVTLSSEGEDMVPELTRCLGRLKFICNCSVRFLAALPNSQQVGATQVFIDGWMYSKNKMLYENIYSKWPDSLYSLLQFFFLPLVSIPATLGSVLVHRDSRPIPACSSAQMLFCLFSGEHLSTVQKAAPPHVTLPLPSPPSCGPSLYILMVRIMLLW